MRGCSGRQKGETRRSPPHPNAVSPTTSIVMSPSSRHMLISFPSASALSRRAISLAAPLFMGSA